MGLFGSPKIDGEELQQCLTYLEAESNLIALQSREADLFNNSMIEYGNSIINNPSATEDMKKATQQLARVATEILKEHDDIKDVPAAVSTMHSAWQTAFLINSSWASAMVKAIESNIFAFLATAKDISPEIIHAQQLAEEYHKAYNDAQNEFRRLLKKLKLSAEDKYRIEARAAAIDTTD